MKRVLQLCAVDFTAYHLLGPLGRALRDAGLEVSFCCSAGAGLDRLAEEGFRAFPIPVARSYNVFKHAVSLARIWLLLRRERFAILHAHTPVAGIIGRVAARLAGTPVVVYTAHGFYFHEGMSRPAHAFFVQLERFGARLSDLIFVQSEEDWREALRSRIAPPGRVVHIGNGVDPARFARDGHREAAARFRAEIGAGDGPVVAFVGRIVREKGAIEFARACGQVAGEFPAAHFVMIGSPLASDRDSCRAEIDRLQGELGLGSRLHLAGYRTDVPALLAACDLFVLPSYREGMPRSVIEAMAASLPVVATDIRGCREEVVDGVTGLLVPPRDSAALAGAMRRILSLPDRGRSLGEAGRARVLERFDERAILALEVEWILRTAARKLQK